MALVFATQPALGHQPFESTVEGRLQHNRLEIKIITSELAARQLAGNPVGPGESQVDPQSLLPRLREQAGSFIIITTDQGALTPTKIDAQFNKLNELETVLLYPEPPHGKIEVDAAFLRQMPLGYGSTLTILDENENVLIATPALTRTQSTLAWSWPAPAAIPAITVHGPVTNNSALGAAQPITRHEITRYWITGLGLVSAVVLLATCLRKRFCALFCTERNAP